MELVREYKNYRWFITSEGNLVIGGKNSEQNDRILSSLKKQSKDFIVMHTSEPGSPFCVILADKSSLKKSEIHETAIFTGCFSKCWKKGRKRAIVDIFNLSQLYKSPDMEKGTWGVIGKVGKIPVELKLYLIKQRGVLRAVPKGAVKGKTILFLITPGNKTKEEQIANLKNLLKDYPEEEILSALPAGGITIKKP